MLNINDWYDYYQNDINNIFNEIMAHVNQEDNLMDSKDVYKNFVIFLYKNSTKDPKLRNKINKNKYTRL